MAEILRQLREEHGNMTRLLTALEHQLAVFDQGEQPDYDVLMAAADYFTGFSVRCHHPKEDLIFQKMKEVDAAAAHSIPDLDSEHEQIAGLARHFQEAVRNVLEEVEVPRSAFDAVLLRFISEERRHMQMEEQQFLPFAEKVLGAEDWADLAAKAAKEGDPLCGAVAAGKFQSLLRKILEWERED